MICPTCNNNVNENSLRCDGCGLDLNKSAWVTVITVFPPEDAILKSLIQSFGIPVRLKHSLDNVFGLSVGPLSEVQITVPEEFAARTLDLLKADPEEPWDE